MTKPLRILLAAALVALVVALGSVAWFACEGA
jgi:hypothetical protein